MLQHFVEIWHVSALGKQVRLAAAALIVADMLAADSVIAAATGAAAVTGATINAITVTVAKWLAYSYANR